MLLLFKIIVLFIAVVSGTQKETFTPLYQSVLDATFSAPEFSYVSNLFYGMLPFFQSRPNCSSWIQISEPTQPWTIGNGLCSFIPNYFDGWVFYTEGRPDPTPQSTCVQLYEPSAPLWDNNWLCMPKNADRKFYTFAWYGALPGMICVSLANLIAPTDHGWNDNYFCYGRTQQPTAAISSEALTIAQAAVYVNSTLQYTFFINRGLIKYYVMNKLPFSAKRNQYPIYFVPYARTTGYIGAGVIGTKVYLFYSRVGYKAPAKDSYRVSYVVLDTISGEWSTEQWAYLQPVGQFSVVQQSSALVLVYNAIYDGKSRLGFDVFDGTQWRTGNNYMPYNKFMGPNPSCVALSPNSLRCAYITYDTTTTFFFTSTVYNLGYVEIWPFSNLWYTVGMPLVVQPPTSDIFMLIDPVQSQGIVSYCIQSSSWTSFMGGCYKQKYLYPCIPGNCAVTTSQADNEGSSATAGYYAENYLWFYFSNYRIANPNSVTLQTRYAFLQLAYNPPAIWYPVVDLTGGDGRLWILTSDPQYPWCEAQTIDKSNLSPYGWQCDIDASSGSVVNSFSENLIASQYKSVNDVIQQMSYFIGTAGVIVNGDLTNSAYSSEWDKYSSLSSKVSATVWPMLGNHDYRNNAGFHDGQIRAAQIMSNMADAVKRNGNTNVDWDCTDTGCCISECWASLGYWIDDGPQYRFLMLNDQINYERGYEVYDADKVKTWKMHIHPTRVWLADRMREFDGRKFFLFIHDVYGNDGMASLIDTINTYGADKVCAIFAGHIHSYWGQITSLGNLKIPIFHIGTPIFQTYMSLYIGSDGRFSVRGLANDRNAQFAHTSMSNQFFPHLPDFAGAGTYSC